ncbi:MULTISPECIES: DNA helicase PcrA [unclassified Streptomyces]|jgi:DNA helicase-2/ATP-dependent DNA helicase PcrA|uniref:DNA helicase PcrA n=1 Tax=unclassified Streptomyces TaxID=2593676 RepID=UPI00088ADE0B|nr:MULTISPECIES: DNA helicase PcrA [unclassified Streptomyces]MDX2727434.1 DNA helicase PcrA [Streptomyces sp. PA03-2a]MDX3765073.1 DNA helicase PcrA [Streptomyces sp. AK08-01B]MDX3814652.1 DNA helicase PcrA [Streptomyces sp. AK08-01A]SCY61968.1 DNA helicase-2 / ATP-dependent DNA helicase PcrA [Streptomyces sp. 136MFCol5.1]SFT26576.1 DNA helicase-2 / ATP-dependent DNA helicase PcrA [Streptomyces sp. ok210]
MSSLFDDSFLAGLQHSEEEPPPPPEDSAPEAVPEDLFAGVFDAPPPPRDAYYRDGAHRPVIDAAALLDGLNTEQRAAVVHAGSPLLIVAGAGSGKTRVLTHRIAHLLAERGVHPGQILAITFTNKAAGEMKERVEQLVGPRANAMWVMTFHSACVRILRRESKKLGFTSSFSIYDAADSKRLMALVCRDLDLDPKRFPPKSFTAKVSNLKNELIDEETFAGQAADGFEKTLAQAYAMYQSRLREANALDFDDIIMTTVHLLQAFPDVAEHYRRRFRHVLVDEYQDTNHAQYTLVRELVGPAGPADAPAELCVVGDADQSIYAFRGATIRNILQFEEDYPNATTILLEQNYRSTQTILSAANAVIERNESRRPKNLWTNAGEGARITGYVADTEHDEAQFVADEIDRLTDAGDAKAGDVAIFYRTNAQSRVFEEIFIRVGLPYKVVGGVRFYERKEVRDILAYLRVLANPEDTVPLRRILNVPKRGIGDRAEAMIDALSLREKITFPQALRRVDEAYGMAARSANAVKRFNTLMEELRTIVESGAGPAVVLEAVLERTGYLAELQASTDPQDETRIENLQELAAVALEFEQERGEADAGEGASAGTLAEFLEKVALVADSDQIPDEDTDGSGVITLMTLHTAKGLEFPVVFLTGMEDGVFPHMRALGQVKELEEERRLAYVGITRARERLYLTRAAMRSAWGQPSYNPPSRFLEEIPDQHLQWKRTGPMAAPAGPTSGITSSLSSSRSRSGPSGFATRRTSDKPTITLVVGDRVTHDQFGLGTVTAVEGVGDQAKATVDFGDERPKKLLLRYAPVEKL